MMHTFEIGDQVQAGTPNSCDFDLGVVTDVDLDEIHIRIRWIVGQCSTVERWDRTDLQYVPSCARCSHQYYHYQDDELVCTHCGLHRSTL